ncbi:MAG: PUR family DNA/RNA-binding protein [Cytophagales bacterium]|nr:PUR family DNA/RNA-binding protein [Cytophagales bacterium]
MEEQKEEKEEIYSNRIRAGKRTYFFDIKSTKGQDYFLTITESKKRFKADGHYYEKHKIFLYKEDLEKFSEALQEAVNYIKTELLPEYDFSQEFQSAERNDDGELKWD